MFRRLDPGCAADWPAGDFACAAWGFLASGESLMPSQCDLAQLTKSGGVLRLRDVVGEVVAHGDVRGALVGHAVDEARVALAGLLGEGAVRGHLQECLEAFSVEARRACLKGLRLLVQRGRGAAALADEGTADRRGDRQQGEDQCEAGHGSKRL
eukprot:CAMPEP_0175289354 /NCGR_PEP_ID=MMETSP0093-20121207/55289_1 /TAXON_ID=311494 /ORGANISM="Alexandrium monilatum, Strain CCMP3105" /LENGTH=153 /DNA_ID=CAMNT_0016584955 /DNA_START=38 /DNA_END=498 /DNA_ORIENTATION=-